MAYRKGTENTWLGLSLTLVASVIMVARCDNRGRCPWVNGVVG
jgi:hypothetical protein